MNKKLNYTPFTKFVFRTPLLPYSALRQLKGNINETKKNLLKIYKSSCFQEAIFISSENLFFKLNKYLKENNLSSKEETKLNYSLLKYLLRMSTRCTPFGYLASVNLGTIGNTNSIHLGHKDETKICAELDMYILYKLINKLLKNKNILKTLMLYTNTSLYKIDETFRYTEVNSDSKNKYRMISIEKEKIINEIIKKSCSGISYKLLHKHIKLYLDKTENYSEITNNEIDEYLFDLIQNQILVTELMPKVTSPNFYNQILNFVNTNTQIVSSLKQKFNNINNNLCEINSNKVGDVISNYFKIKDIINLLGLRLKPPYLNIELKKKVKKAEISQKTISCLTKALNAFFKLADKKNNKRLEDFKTRFLQQYEEQEVLLTNALDPELGLVYGKTIPDEENDCFIKDLDLPINKESTIKITKAQAFILKKIYKAKAEKLKTIYLSDEELNAFEYNKNKLPQNFTCLAKLLSSNFCSDFLISLIGVYGGAASKPIARFANNDKNIKTFISEITQKEIEKSATSILAEIVFFPVDKTANVVKRPSFYNYEIAYMAKSEKKIENQINISDLYLSVKNNRFYLRSKKLNKEIIPRLTNAHSYFLTSLPTYIFLSDLSSQDSFYQIQHNFINLLSIVNFLPRICYDKTIFCPAIWQFSNKDEIIIKMILAKNNKDLIDFTNKWKNKHNLPSIIVLVQGEFELHIDLDSIVQIKLFVNEIKNKTSFLVSEFLFNNNSNVATDSYENFTNEILVSYQKNS